MKVPKTFILFLFGYWVIMLLIFHMLYSTLVQNVRRSHCGWLSILAFKGMIFSANLIFFCKTFHFLGVYWRKTLADGLKFADRTCLISEKILIRNCGYYKPCTMGNPGCCEELKGCLLSTTSFWLITMIWLSFLCYAYNTHNWKLLLIPFSQTGLLAKLVIAMCKSLFLF